MVVEENYFVLRWVRLHLVALGLVILSLALINVCIPRVSIQDVFRLARPQYISLNELFRSLHNRRVIDKMQLNNQRLVVMVQRVFTKQISTSETVKADNCSQFVSAYI